MIKRHQRPVPGRPNLQVGVIEKEGPIHVSNVAIVDPKDHKPTRVGVTRNEQGKRVRVDPRAPERSSTDGTTQGPIQRRDPRRPRGEVRLLDADAGAASWSR